ncbi:MAG: AMP-binding protein [Pseudomonadota bacterium]
MSTAIPAQLSASIHSIPALLAARALEQPDDEALVINNRRLTWREVERETARVAGGLHELGVRAGEHVGICAGNSVEWISTWFAAAHLGAAVVPLNTRWKDEELAWALDYADVRYLVFDQRLLKVDYLAIFGRLRSRLPKLRAYLLVGDARCDWGSPFEALAGDPPPTCARPESITLIQFTSGSTARPRGVMLTQAGMLANARGGSLHLGVRQGDRYFCPRPFFHVAGSTGGPLRALAAGACLISIPSFDAAAAIAILRAERCEMVAGNDAMFLKLLESFDGREGLRLRGGQAAAGPEVQRQIHERLGITGLCCSYGLSESSPGVAFSRWDDPIEDRIAGLMWPLPGVSIRIRDPVSGVDNAPGESGEILVKGPSVMVGYYKMPEATAAVLDTEGWLTTGDLGVLEADGRLRFIGRLKDIIRVGGENVSPAEVEDLLLRHPEVSAAQVVALPDARLGEVPVAYVALRTGARVDGATLIAWARERIAGFKVPRHIGIVPSFDDVLTGSGKPQKAILRQRALADFAAIGGSQA